MLKQRRNLLWLALTLSSLYTSAHAAELRGHLTGMPGAALNIECPPDRGGNTIVKQDGNYAVLGLPPNRDCSFTIIFENQESIPIPFSTFRSVTIFNGHLQLYEGRIVVIRQ